MTNEEGAFYQVERDVMTGCFAVHWLGMSSKVAKQARATNAAVIQFPFLL